MTERTICHILDKVLHLESLESRIISLENKNLQLEEKNAELLGEFCDLEVKFEEMKQFIKDKIEEIFEEDEDQMDGDSSGSTSVEFLDLEDQNISSETESSPNKENFENIEDSLESAQKTPIKILTPTSADISKIAEESLDTTDRPILVLSKVKPPTFSRALKDQNGLKMAKIDIQREVEIKKEAEKIQDIYPCTNCPQNFSRSSALTTHKKIHSKKTEFKCTTCPKNFSDPGTLHKHMKRHLVDKTYECPEPECKLLKFKTKSQLSAHKVIHRNDTNKKLHKCQICEKEFGYKYILKIHTRIHSGEKPYKCQICKKEFRFNSNLIAHTRIHSGEKPYKCQICKKEFSLNFNLKTHNRIHTGEKPYNCSICKKSFTQKNNLTLHSKTHHKTPLAF